MNRRRVVTTVVVALCLGSVVAACAPPKPPPPPPPPGLEPPDSPLPPGSPSLTTQTVVSGLVNPWDMSFLADGTMFFTERQGTIKVRKDRHLDRNGGGYSG